MESIRKEISERNDLMTITMEVKKEVLDLKAAGMPASEISQKIGIAKSTIDCCWKKWQQELIAAGYYSQHVGIVPDDAETQAKRRAVRLMDQGWKAVDAAKKAQLKAEDIAQHWEEWAAELGMEIIQRIERPCYHHGEVKEVTLPAPETAPDMPCPVEKEEENSMESSAKSMEASVKSMDKSILATRKMDAAYSLMGRINAIIHGYLMDEGKSLRDVSQEMEISEGHLTVVLSLNLGETAEVWEAVEDV